MATILVALDSSDASRAGLEAAKLLGGRHGRLILFTVLPTPSDRDPRGPEHIGFRWPGRPESMIPAELPSGTPPPDDRRTIADRMQEEALSEMEGLAEPLRREGFDVVCDMAFGGDPAQEILAQADHHNADAIAVGTHGHSRISSALIGSVSSDLVRALRRPVIVAPYREEKGG